jgi:hypothetical protein
MIKHMESDLQLPHTLSCHAPLNFTLEQASDKRVDVQFDSFFNLGARWGSGQRHAPVFLVPGKTRYPSYEAEWAPEPVWTSVENLAPTGIRSPDRPARSESRYRLSYPLINSGCFNFSYISYFSLKITNFQEAFTTTIPFSIVFLFCNICFNIIRCKQERAFSDQSTVQINRKKGVYLQKPIN